MTTTSQNGIDEIAREIATSCMNTINRWKLYKAVNDSIDDYQQEFDYSPRLWLHFLDAMSLSVVLGVSRLYDTTSGAASLKNALQEIATLNPPTLDINQLAHDLDVVDPQKNLRVGNLREIRNKVIAHMDAKGIRDGIDWHKTNPVLLGDVDVLLEDAWQISTRYAQLLTGVVWRSWSEIPFDDDDFQKVLDSVRETLKMANSM